MKKNVCFWVNHFSLTKEFHKIKERFMQKLEMKDLFATF